MKEMSRKQRRLIADARRKEITVKISEIVHEAVKAGKNAQGRLLGCGSLGSHRAEDKTTGEVDVSGSRCGILQVVADCRG